MRPGRYTIIVQDNVTNETMLELDANKLNFSFESVKAGAVLTLEAAILERTEEAEIPKFELNDDLLDSMADEVTIKIEDCHFGHSWRTATGLLDSYEYCEICNLKKDDH